MNNALNKSSAGSSLTLEEQCLYVEQKFIQQYRLLGNNSDYFIIAVNEGYMEAVRFYVEQGADIGCRDNAALRWSVMHGQLEIVQYLEEQGGDLHVNEDYLLYLAVVHNQREIVKYLLLQKADINVDHGEILVGCIENKHYAMADFLLANGADLDLSLETAKRRGLKNEVEYFQRKQESQILKEVVIEELITKVKTRL